jgi:hypothetical protein
MRKVVDKLITRADLLDFCTNVVLNQFMQKPTIQEQKDINKFIHEDIVTDGLLKLFVQWELEVWGDMIVQQPGVFVFGTTTESPERIIEGTYNGSNGENLVVFVI